MATKQRIEYEGIEGQVSAAIAGSEDEVTIEVHPIDHWSEGLARLLEYTGKRVGTRPILYLHGEVRTPELWGSITDICAEMDIEVMRHEQDFEALKKMYKAKRVTMESTFEEIADSLSIPIVELGPRELISRETLKTQQDHLKKCLRLTATAINSMALIDPRLSAESVPIYIKLAKELAVVQECITDYNEKGWTAARFLESDRSLREGSTLSMQRLIEKLKRWCLSNQIPNYMSLVPSIREILSIKNFVLAVNEGIVVEGFSIHPQTNSDSDSESDEEESSPEVEDQSKSTNRDEPSSTLKPSHGEGEDPSTKT